MIVVFGSLNIDLVMPVHHFPKPGETVLCSTDYLSRPGGKGSNQAVAAARAGAKVAMVGKVGDDSFGRRCINNLKNQSVWAAGIGISERPTGCATIAVDMQGANIVMVAPGANLDATSDQVPDEVFNSDNIVLAQLETSAKETFSVLARAHQKKTPTILNASPVHMLPAEALRVVNYLIVNELEGRQLAHNIGIVGSDPRQLARDMAVKHGLHVIITMEAKGALAAMPDGALYHIKALPVEVVDTTGAGDAFCGIFAACLQKKQTIQQALHSASVGASLSCLGLGAQAGMPFEDDIRASLDKIDPPQKIA
jgi:ribokinase